MHASVFLACEFIVVVNQCVCAFSQDLLKQSEKEALVVGSLLRRAQEIQLGPQNQTLLQERARALSQQLDQAQAQLKKE